MALVRCPGCKFDTSDSLAVCPHCGIALRGGAPSGRPTEIFAEKVSIRRNPGSTATAAGPARALARPWGSHRPLAAIPLLIALFAAPYLLPPLIVAGMAWLMRKQRRSSEQNLQTEVFEILLRNSGAAPRGPVGRPLEHLRTIERKLDPKRDV